MQEAAFAHRETAAFFAGLLPEGDVRVHLARHLGLSKDNIFALLKEIGGDCAGALSLWPPDARAETASLRVLTDQEAHDILSSLEKHPLLAGEDGIRISGAGAQNKLMVCWEENQLAIPRGTMPSTHILKPPIRDLQDTVHNEFFCMSLAKAIGLSVPNVSIYWLHDIPYYVVKRYDRGEDHNGQVMRYQQEDFCQALGLPPEMKYEKEGGPTIADCFTLLDDRMRRGLMPGRDKIELLKAVIFNYLIGNGDAHGKNFSILYDGEAERLAPFYDLLSTILYDNAHKAKMAMKIAGHYKFSDIALRHFEAMAKECSVTAGFMKKHVKALTQSILPKAQALKESLNKDPQTQSDFYDKILERIEKQCHSLSL